MMAGSSVFLLSRRQHRIKGNVKRLVHFLAALNSLFFQAYDVPLCGGSLCAGGVECGGGGFSSFTSGSSFSASGLIATITCYLSNLLTFSKGPFGYTTRYEM